MQLLKLIKIMLLCFLLTACSRQPSSHGQIITVAPSATTSTLFYTGIIQPLNTQIIASPAEGVIVDMPVQYGETVKQGQLLFALSSSKFLTDYKNSLLAYLKAKSDFNNNKVQLDEATLLHKNELISDDDFKSKQTAYYTAQLALLQAKDTLDIFLQQLNIKDTEIYNLSIADIDQINHVLHAQTNTEFLRVFARTAGTLLSPTKNEEEVKKMGPGDMVKQGDVLAIIGNMQGVSVRVKVNELIVNQLSTGQHVKITGIAFPEEILLGKINRIDRQGDVIGGGLPTFNVEILVPTLTLAQQKQIHVGMSAKIEIALDEVAQISVPIKAVSENNGVAFINVYEEKTGKTHAVAIKTGKTTLDSVAVLSGLKQGDKIVVPS